MTTFWAHAEYEVRVDFLTLARKCSGVDKRSISHFLAFEDLVPVHHDVLTSVHCLQLVLGLRVTVFQIDSLTIALVMVHCFRREIVRLC